MWDTQWYLHTNWYLFLFIRIWVKDYFTKKRSWSVHYFGHPTRNTSLLIIGGKMVSSKCDYKDRNGVTILYNEYWVGRLVIEFLRLLKMSLLIFSSFKYLFQGGNRPYHLVCCRRLFPRQVTIGWYANFFVFLDISVRFFHWVIPKIGVKLLLRRE